MFYVVIVELYSPSKEVDMAKSSQERQENSSWEARQGELKVMQGPLLPRCRSPSCV